MRDMRRHHNGKGASGVAGEKTGAAGILEPDVIRIVFEGYGVFRGRIAGGFGCHIDKIRPHKGIVRQMQEKDDN
jgi:hypothetical protein